MTFIHISDKIIMDRRNNHRHFQKSLFSEFQPEAIKPLSVLQQNARWVMGTCLVASDIFSIFLSFILAIFLRRVLIDSAALMLFTNLIIFVFVYILIYALYGLYPGVGLSPVDEIKKLLTATSFSFLFILAFTFFSQTSITYSRFVLASAWLFSLMLVQLDRWLIRIAGRNLGFWGEPVAVIGNGSMGRQIVKFLKNNLRLGMRPYLMLNGKGSFDTATIASINKSKISTAILVIPEMSKKLQHTFIYEQRFGYHRRKGEKNIQRLILISSLSWIGSLGIIAHDLDGMIGLEVRQNLLRKGDQIFKRFIDLLLTIIFGTISFPFLMIITACILIDSPGGVFYKQKRVGHGGKIFEMWKFRTMFADSESVLEKFLAKNPEKKKEWDEKQKIKNDPRITRVGKFLRRLSLDEIPQIINVLKGEMSFVGPRPFFPEQKRKYGSSVNLYNRVLPGITGMWQVMGRNRLSFRERVRLDEYYIRNWSIWLYIYILMRTVWVVLKQDGAY